MSGWVGERAIGLLRGWTGASGGSMRNRASPQQYQKMDID